jgi:hypothetical protein
MACISGATGATNVFRSSSIRYSVMVTGGTAGPGSRQVRLCCNRDQQVATRVECVGGVQWQRHYRLFVASSIGGWFVMSSCS